MKFARFSLLGLLFYALTSFAEPLPVPESKSAYIGNWQGKDMELKIAASGKIFYKRVYGSEKKLDFDIELTGFSGDNFIAGWGIFHSTFYVTRPPTKLADKTIMVVDEVELTKVD